MQAVTSDEAESSGAEPKRTLLRFHTHEMWEQIERARLKGAVKIPRNTWVLMAIAEKLARDLPKASATE